MKKLFLFLLLGFVQIASAQKPNIIVILCDDLGYGDLGVMGHPYIQSPHIDGLARDGIRFTEAYMSGAWCGPSRSALMSGIYPARNFNSNNTLPPEGPSLARMLKEVGYTTAHYGKWHLGPRKGASPPSDFGFDDALIYNGTGPTWPQEQLRDPHWREHSTATIVDSGIAFMEKAGGQPFFINLWVYPTHSYIDPTPEMLEAYKDLEVDINDFENPLQREFLEFIGGLGNIQDAMRAYCADVTELDKQVGRLLQHLDEHGLTENTIVIFSSDNGAAPLCDNWDEVARRAKEKPTLLNCVGSSGPFRDRKISLHDGGTRVPFFVRWPAKIKAGQIDGESVLGGVDLMPTLARITGGKVPTGIDGIDRMEIWLGKAGERSAPLYWNDRPGWSALRDKQWKAHLQKNKFRLYNIVEDPSESNEISEMHPEVAERYLKLLKSWESGLPKK